MNKTENNLINKTDSIEPSSTESVLRNEIKSLNEKVDSLKHRVAWFENQLFGQKSEKRQTIDNPLQQSLLAEATETKAIAEDKIIVTYQRGTAKKKRPDDCVTDSGLRFNDDVPVEIIEILPSELQSDTADQYVIIDTKVSHKLAQRPSSYVILRYETPVIKKKGTEIIQSTIMPDQVLDGSIADVSFIVGMLVDKFLYHLPLHRQHQRLQQAGITLSIATLTNVTQRGIELLRPIVDALLAGVLQSKVLAMDETPIKAGKKQKGKLKQAYFWPIYGENDEIVFTYSNSRGRQHIEETLSNQFTGTLLTDGYAAYARYAKKTEGVDHAQCWAHTRRKFIEAEDAYPELAAEILELIRQLYLVEAHIKENHLTGDKKQQYRLEHSKDKVGQIIEWCQHQLNRNLTPKDPLKKAISYLLNRQ